MKFQPHEMQNNAKGFVLALVIIMVTLISFSVIVVVGLVTQDIRISRANIARTTALYAAEGGAYDGLWRVGNHRFSGDYDFLFNHKGQEVPVDVSVNEPSPGLFEIEASAIFEGREETVFVEAMYRPPSQALDHSYFINNWGWFHGDSIVNWGDVRSNGPFSFAHHSPRVMGDIYTHMYIEGGGNIQGKGSSPEKQHENMPILTMSNIQFFEDNSDFAYEQGGSLSYDGEVLIDGALGDNPGEKRNIYLKGTQEDPIEIDGPVAVKGDVVIEGYITGQGTIYTGGNIYVAGDVQYLDGPHPRVPAVADPPGWVRNNIDKDLVGFAAWGNIVFGDFTNNTWRSNVNSWMNDSRNESSEENLGPDGIPNTPLDGTPNDVNQNGIIDPRATLETFDFNDPFHADYYKNLPEEVDTGGWWPSPINGQNDYSHLATTAGINNLDGVYYTNHFLAGRMGHGGGVSVYGSLISRNESIIYNNELELNHDGRLDSSFASEYDIYELLSLNVGLPPSQAKFAITNWEIGEKTSPGGGPPGDDPPGGGPPGGGPPGGGPPGGGPPGGTPPGQQ